MLQLLILTSVPNYRLQQDFYFIPSNLPGTDFTTPPMMSNNKVIENTTRHDHDNLNTSQVHFLLRDDDWVVRMRCNQTNDILALIPWSKFRRDLPPALVEGHVHWLNLSTKIIEIRPVKRLWEQSSENWRIDCASGQYRMYRGCETLVDIRSPSWAMVSKCFECLNNVDENESRNLLITTFPIDSAYEWRLSVALPRYFLSFFVNEREELESRDFKDMVYDEDQCIDTLFGLENLLVLRPKTHIAGALIPEALIPRRVLIPNGFPKTHGIHQVRIDIRAVYHAGPDERLTLYRTYDVDLELGCLTGNGSLASTCCLAYLHAMTSCHRPDPLTGKTGAQAALCLLQSAGCRSIMKLKAFDTDDLWTSTQYPQINTAYQEILNRYHWNRNSRQVSASDKHAARRVAYLFPSNATGPTSLDDYAESKCLTTSVQVPAEPGLALLHSISSFNESSPREIALDQLLCNRPVPELPTRRSALICDRHDTSSDDTPILDQLFFSLRGDSSFQREYIAHLDNSAQSLCVVSQATDKMGENLLKALGKYYVQCRVNYLDALDILKKSLGPTSDPHEQTLHRLGQWPPITADVLLRYLATTSPVDVPPCWKKCLISLALLLLQLQHARRLLRFAQDGCEEELLKELENEGCDGWDPEQYPDWLLIQVASFYLNPHCY